MTRIDLNHIGKWAVEDNAKVLRQFDNPNLNNLEFYEIFPGGYHWEDARFTTVENAVKAAYTYQTKKGTSYHHFTIGRYVYGRNSKNAWVKKDFKTVGHLSDNDQSNKDLFEEWPDRWVYWDSKGHYVVKRGTITTQRARTTTEATMEKRKTKKGADTYLLSCVTVKRTPYSEDRATDRKYVDATSLNDLRKKVIADGYTKRYSWVHVSKVTPDHIGTEGIGTLTETSRGIEWDSHDSRMPKAVDPKTGAVM